MYKKFFGIRKAPFSIAPDPRYLFMSGRHREALAHLLYGIKSDAGFVMLTGEVGTGKTTLCRCLLQKLPKNFAVAFVLNPKLSVIELLATICDEFRIGYPKKAAGTKVFIDLINGYLLEAHAGRKRALLIIDEAQNLSNEVLEQIRLLTNLETDERKLLQIILIGQPELRDKLAEPQLRQLAQRIVARYHLGPLSKAEVPLYVNHRLQVAGARSELFLPGSLARLYAITGGVPRVINAVCDRALLGAYVQGKKTVDAPTISNAAAEVLGTPWHAGRTGKKAAVAAAVVVLVLVSAALYYLRDPILAVFRPNAPLTEAKSERGGPVPSPEARQEKSEDASPDHNPDGAQGASTGETASPGEAPAVTAPAGAGEQPS